MDSWLLWNQLDAIILPSMSITTCPEHALRSMDDGPGNAMRWRTTLNQWKRRLSSTFTRGLLMQANEHVDRLNDGERHILLCKAACLSLEP